MAGAAWPKLTLARLRTICLALPEAVEKTTWDAPTFRIRDKIFAMVHDTGGRSGVWFKAPPGVQTILTEADPQRFFSPPYVGPKGWVGVWLDRSIDWEEMADLISRSYRMTAPKRPLEAGEPEAVTRAGKRTQRRRTTQGR